MYIKRYSIAALLLIAAVGWSVYGFISKESMHISVMGIVLPALPVAVWVSAAMLLLYFATLFHMIFYSIIGNFRLRRYERDFAHLLEAIGDAFLRKPDRSHRFKTDRYALLGQIADQTQMEPFETLGTLGDPKLAAIVQTLYRLERGESVELKRFSLAPDNALVRQNQLNQYREGALEDEAVLGKADQYDARLCRMAFNHLAETAPLHLIEKYKKFMTFDAVVTLIKRINAEENTLSIPNETLRFFIKGLEDLTPLDFLFLAGQAGENMLPEQRIRLFESLSEENDKAIDGYLLTLFDLEMIDKAREILSGTAADDYMLFRAFAELKSCNKHYDINIFASMMLQGYERP